MPKKLFNIKVYSGRGDFNTYHNLTRAQIRMIVRDIRTRNWNLFWAHYPQRRTYKIEEAIK